MNLTPLRRALRSSLLVLPVLVAACAGTEPPPATPLPAAPTLPEPPVAASTAPDDPDVPTLVRRLEDPAMRAQAAVRLVQRYEDAMTQDAGDRGGVHVKPLVEQIVEPLTARCVRDDPADPAHKAIVKLLADTRDPRAAACYTRVLEDFRPGVADAEENARAVARAVGAMKLQGASGPLLHAFIALRPSALKKQHELYRDVHDAMVRILDPAWEAVLLGKLERPIVDLRDIPNLRDEAFWQVTAAEILGRLRSANAVRPLLKVVVSPSKVDVAPSAVEALVEIGKPALAAAVALLRAEDRELVAYARAEHLRAAAGADGKVPDAAQLAAEKAHVGAAALVLGRIGRAEAAAPMLKVLEAPGDPLQRALLARELPRLVLLPGAADTRKAFRIAYEKTPTALTIPPGQSAREVLLEAAGYFFDAGLVPWIVKDAVALTGEPDDVAAIRGTSYLTALKLMTPAQEKVVEQLARIKDTSPDGKATTIGEPYAKEHKIVADLLAACGAKVDCYLATLVDPASQANQTQFRGIKAVYMIGVHGGPETGQKLVDALPKVTNAAIRYLIGQVIDHGAPRGDPAIASALQKMVDDGVASGDFNRMAGNATLKSVIRRLFARTP